MSKRKTVLQSFGGVRGVTLMLGALVVVFVFNHWRATRNDDALREVGTELGLEVHEEGKRRQLRGRIEDIGVAVDTTTERLGGDVHWYTDFKLYAPGQPHGRIVGASLRQKAIGGMKSSEWLHTGDEAFDDAVLVEGDPAVMLAHLDEEARRAVEAAADAGWALDRVTWTARASGRVGSAQKIRVLLDLGLAAARALRLDGDPVRSLRERADGDPSPGVRAAATAALESEGTTAPERPAGDSEPVTAANALQALAEVSNPRSLDAALLLARSGDDRQEVRNRLVSATFSQERLAEVIEALGEVGGQLEIAVLGTVKGEHEAAAKAAIATIEARL